jgi:hypothetical protein
VTVSMACRTQQSERICSDKPWKKKAFESNDILQCNAAVFGLSTAQTVNGGVRSARKR